MVSSQLHYITNREEIFIFNNKKMTYLCDLWRFANAYYCETEKGEIAPAAPTYNEWSVVWENNVGKSRVMLHRMDEDKEGVLQQLGMVDLRRNPD